MMRQVFSSDAVNLYRLRSPGAVICDAARFGAVDLEELFTRQIRFMQEILNG